MLTVDERKEFTILAAIAFDIARVEAQKTGTMIPCWLCSSREAKDTMLAKAAEFVGNAAAVSCRNACGCIIPPTVELAANLCAPLSSAIQPKLEKWIAAEEMMKEEREKSNPAAFFV